MLDGTRGQPPKLLDEVQQVLRLHHYSMHTERSYVEWIVRFVRFYGIGPINAVRAAKKINVPVVMTREDVTAVISHLDGTAQLVTTLLYGSGLRIMEAVRIRIKDIMFR